MSASSDRSVGKVMLSDQDGDSRHLDVTVTGKSGVSTNISARVPLTAISDAFIQGNKLVVTGRAQNAFAVEIFDATTGEKLDWFYCSTPTRVSDQLLVYVESYPDHTPYDFNTVLLAYDLSRNPLDNRLTEGKRPQSPPLSTTAQPESEFQSFPNTTPAGSHTTNWPRARHRLSKYCLEFRFFR
jgi:hypothetical protein